MALSSRVRVYRAWQNADADLRHVKQTHERNIAQGKAAAEKVDRLRHSYSQIGEVRLFTLCVSRRSLHTRNSAIVGGTTRVGCEAGIRAGVAAGKE
jgi:hypothetical protein